MFRVNMPYVFSVSTPQIFWGGEELFAFCGKICMTKFANLTIFKSSVQWHSVRSCCCAAVTPIQLQDPFHLVKLKLSPLNSNSPFPLSTTPGACHPFCLYESTPLGTSHKWNHAGSVLLCSFFHSAPSSRLLHTRACVRISSFSGINPIPLYVPTDSLWKQSIQLWRDIVSTFWLW